MFKRCVCFYKWLRWGSQRFLYIQVSRNYLEIFGVCKETKKDYYLLRRRIRLRANISGRLTRHWAKNQYNGDNVVIILFMVPYLCKGCRRDPITKPLFPLVHRTVCGLYLKDRNSLTVDIFFACNSKFKKKIENLKAKAIEETGLLWRFLFLRIWWSNRFSHDQQQSIQPKCHQPREVTTTTTYLTPKKPQWPRSLIKTNSLRFSVL